MAPRAGGQKTARGETLVINSTGDIYVGATLFKYDDFGPPWTRDTEYMHILKYNALGLLQWELYNPNNFCSS